MSKKQPDISVIIACFNDEDYIQQAVESVLSQNYITLEVIVIDDCSTDNTPTILKKLIKLDQRITAYRNYKNMGLTRSLNIAIDMCSGVYLARLDSDDLCLPDRLFEQKRYLDANQHIALVGTHAIKIDEDGNFISNYKNLSLSHNEIVSRLLSFKSYCPHSSWMARRNIFTDFKYNESYRYSQDYDLLLRLVHSGQNLALLNRPLTALRIHKNSITNIENSSIEQIIYSIASLTEFHLKEIKKSNIPSASIINDTFTIARSKGLYKSVPAYRDIVLAVAAFKGQKYKLMLQLIVRIFLMGPSVWYFTLCQTNYKKSIVNNVLSIYR